MFFLAKIAPCIISLHGKTDNSLMQDRVKIHDKWFKPFIPEAVLKERVKAVAKQISADLADKNPLFLSVLTGSFVFAADLLRYLDFSAEVEFVRVSSYKGLSSTGDVQEIMGLKGDISGRTVVIVEDIVDSGLSMDATIKMVKKHNPAEVKVCTLMCKPDCLKVKVPIDYMAMEIPEGFIVGYGLDYNQLGRNLKDIYVIDEKQE